MLDENLITFQVEDYIAYKRSLGYKIKAESQELRRFAAYTRSIGYTGSLRVDIAMAWASLNWSLSRWYMSRRLETIHTFAIYVSAFDPNAQIPSTGVFGKCHGRIEPYIYTESELQQLMIEAQSLDSPDKIRKYTVSTALGLLWATGIRVSELTSLTLRDVCFEEGYLYICNSKFKKNRLVPLDLSAVTKLKEYSLFLDGKIPHRREIDYFFVTSYGKRFSTRSFEYAFQLIRPCLLKGGRANWERRAPRLYDIRHTFACRTIQRWLEEGVDVNHRIYQLSTYMGHVKRRIHTGIFLQLPN